MDLNILGGRLERRSFHSDRDPAREGKCKNSVAFQVRDVEVMFGERYSVDLNMIGCRLERCARQL